ncbi:MAG: dTMP kinase [Candidatus Yonathbacteria bacterium RIFCSPHIGHO2_01_FULL_44_41]|uniref:Thymidylate kinase n=1 Tax=Candidatus Yonathbacteria bacterium RIFCSPHIGHO2_02_FULL_44_14 TaxID=1802724 RepID=A0A1G2S7X9_9BACT|nr:MAG: dTMP kinase [Candidatus Yonathbacteria bacterium RIFCSPHIGHO2_01_FULL_44_41]OHA81159.1 MAG: dTMP kinase [Candidatus Yonathbacteria bacterium RIFCSPLOWO2_01_FULL_43_20]OHA81223.1 MAG: dTMP kinase [Candidatus Yonathbacteria bacterium RIFCSPHIGHO2_02_FULL_44_14]
MKTPFIVIDGLDGSGKTTQLKLLCERAEREGKKFILTREPGGAPLSEALRELFKSELGLKASALTQLLMVTASRRNCMEEAVWPFLAQGITVFSDRCDSSTLAYQVYAKNAPELEEEFWRLRKLVFGEYPPTTYIFLDVLPRVARNRVVGDDTRGEISHFDAAPLKFYERVYEGFRAFENHPTVKMYSVNGARCREEIQEDIYRIVKAECGW